MASLYDEKNSITYDASHAKAGELPKFRPSGPIIKWYNVKMTYEEKFRFGLLTYPEYCAWMQEIAEAQNEEAEKKPSSGGGKTFWANDDGERMNVSADEFSDFLSQNNIDVTNNATVDIAALFDEANGEIDTAPPKEETKSEALVSEDELNAILSNVNKDIKGSDCLTQEEIAALFAAANN